MDAENIAETTSIHSSVAQNAGGRATYIQQNTAATSVTKKRPRRLNCCTAFMAAPTGRVSFRGQYASFNRPIPATCVAGTRPYNSIFIAAQQPRNEDVHDRYHPDIPGTPFHRPQASPLSRTLSRRGHRPAKTVCL